MSSPNTNTHLASHTRPLLAPKTRLQIDSLTGNPILLYPEGVVVLNATGIAILKYCDGRSTFSELILELARTYQEKPENLQDDVKEYLLHLHKHSLILFT